MAVISRPPPPATCHPGPVLSPTLPPPGKVATRHYKQQIVQTIMRGYRQHVTQHRPRGSLSSSDRHCSLLASSSPYRLASLSPCRLASSSCGSDCKNRLAPVKPPANMSTSSPAGHTSTHVPTPPSALTPPCLPTKSAAMPNCPTFSHHPQPPIPVTNALQLPSSTPLYHAAASSHPLPHISQLWPTWM